jgi:BirA family biotin operon repressor/biotin-[acetyl-CoA-carboxylase] ligase
MLEYSAESIRANLPTLILGRVVEMHRQVASTNDLVKQAGRRGDGEGLVLLAEEQLQGRGRLGRTWTAPPGSSVLCSVLLRPRFSPQHAFYLTISAALAIYRALGQPPPDKTSSIKWPNDVLVNGRKVAGVLSEGEFVGGEWSFAVVGFGINVNLDGDELEALRAVAPQATSLSAEWGEAIDRTTLLVNVLSELESLYLALQNGQFAPIFDEWAGALETIGRRVSVDFGSGRMSGRAVRVERDGSLVIRTESGLERNLLAGDVMT